MRTAPGQEEQPVTSPAIGARADPFWPTRSVIDSLPERAQIRAFERVLPMLVEPARGLTMPCGM
jgi:hypothetical protein